jgi:chromosome segregation ATPase
MKHFQQNLLILLALGLCGLCAYQWYEQTLQRSAIETLNRMVFQKDTDIQNDTNSIANLNQQVGQLDASLTEVKAEVTTNEQVIGFQKAAITKLEFIGEGLTNEITAYTQAVDTLQARLKEAYAGIEKQNEAITNLINQRDEFVKKYNDEVKDRNDVVAKYNDLAKQVQKLQSGGNTNNNNQ